MKPPSQLIIVTAFGLATCLGLLAGCSKSTVHPVPRESNAKPVFGTNADDVGEKASGDINFDFVHADHFACLCFNIPRIVSNQELKDISWNSLEEQLAEVVGAENAKLESIERVWLMLDRQSMSMLMEGTSDGLFVTVIQYKTPPDLDQLAIANANRAKLTDNAGDGDKTPTEPVSISDDDETNSSQPPQFAGLAAQSIGENRIAIGSKQLIGKMNRPQRPNGLSRQLSRLDFSADVEGIIATGPVRETLKSVFGIAAQFGGKEAKKFASLPDVLEQIEIKICLDGGESDELMSIKALIDDPNMIEQVVLATRKAISQSSSESGAGASGMGAMFGDGLQNSQTEQQAIFDLKTTSVAEKFVEDIQEKELFVIDSDKSSVTFRLRRSEHTSELVAAMVADSQQAMEFEQRVSKMQQIAVAMERYHDKHGCFPPAGVVRPEETPEEDSVPPQLNWRVGLLPFLGEQSLYEQFDFKQQWDSELNLKIAQAIPEAFSVVGSDSKPVTRFHLPGGALGLFSPDETQIAKPKTLADITDRKSSTAIVVESSQEHEIVWTKPIDFPIDGASMSEPKPLPVGRADENGVLIISARFEPRIVKKSRVALIRVFTPQGGEKLLRTDFFPMPGK